MSLAQLSKNAAHRSHFSKSVKNVFLKNINYIQMWRKIIDDYRLLYLNDVFEIKLIFLRSISRMLQFSQFVWTLSYSVWDVFNNFLLIDVTDRSKISSDQKRFFIASSLYPLSFFANTPFKCKTYLWKSRLQSNNCKSTVNME